MNEPAWVQHAIWWHVYPLGFVGAEKAATEDPAAAHRLLDLVPWLDYAVELGASGLALGPVFASETHGYDTTDYFRIDARLGTSEDFDTLVREAHRRGLRILLDGVFNHTGRSFGPFQDVLAQGPGAATASWFSLDWPEGATPGAEPGYRDFEGHHHLVALNHGEPAVADFVTDVMEHWLRRGADGWRLDAAYAVPSSFWAGVTARVRASHPDAYFVGEYIHGDYASEVRAGGLDSATQYELWKAVWSSLNDANLFELAAALERHNALLGSFAPLTFLGNHDVTRIASRLTDPALLPHAVAVLLTVGGTPSLYYGDEQGYRGIKEDRAGGDDDVRPLFPPAPGNLSPVGRPVFDVHQELIGVRRRHPWLHRAKTEVLQLSNEVLAYRVAAENPEALVVALNLSSDAQPVPATGALSVLAGQATLDARSGTATLPPRAWAVLG
ncbi:alpha-amylase family glycosyl hydrolase [Arthrobacter sedimenti]|uniref:alpha-amylase family glycosyl hydrolase n=1 Tax=Arthrobacter sedimenti TaxID=2694931 RepID=UPI000B356BD1|nr:alpha-amylase family glycosyl hydrolase [Arthrobacter sedimenti]OUM41733.1 alpha-amylase [Arthrobacter agilis]